jgi:hypothetical protein
MRFNESVIRTIVTAAALTMMVSSACAFDETKYPDWSGQWVRPRGVGTQWDQTKPSGLGQQAPLRPEYFERLKASLADQAAGGQGLDNLYRCIPNGMPRVMSFTFPVEFVILPNITYVNFEIFMPRRIYTDGRSFPTDEEPSFMGYSIGKWLDTDGDGRFDTLEVETRNFKGPRTVESTGIPLHDDNETVVRERISLDKTDNNMMHNEITIVDHALTRPWMVDKHYSRQRKVLWLEASCNENNHHVVIGDQNYFLSGDGYLMPGSQGPAAARPALFQADTEVGSSPDGTPIWNAHLEHPPGDRGDGGDTAGLVEELLPGVLVGIENVVVALEHPVGEIGLAQVLPDVFDRIELRTCRRQRHHCEVFRDLEFARGVPAGLSASHTAATVYFSACSLWWPTAQTYAATA